MLKKKMIISFSYFLFFVSFFYIYFEVDIGIRLLLMMVFLGISLKGFEVLRKEEDYLSIVIMYISTFLSVIFTSLIFYFEAKLTQTFTGFSFSFVAGFITLFSLEKLWKSIVIRLIMIVFIVLYFLQFKSFGLFYFLILGALILPVLILEFLNKKKENILLFYVYIIFIAAFLNPLTMFINRAYSLKTMEFETAGFGIIYDHVTGGGVIPFCEKINNVEIDPATTGLGMSFRLKGKPYLFQGRDYLGSDYLSGAVEIVELNGKEESRFVPDAFAMYYGKNELPFARRDALKIKLDRGILGNWFISDYSIIGEKIEFYTKWYHVSGNIKFLVTGNNGIHFLEKDPIDSNKKRVQGIDRNGRSLYSKQVLFDPLGIAYGGGPLVFGKHTSEETLEEIYFLEFRNDSGEVETGVSFEDIIHNIIPVSSERVIVFHGRLIEIINRKKEIEFQYERKESGPVICSFDNNEMVYFINYMSSELMKLSIKTGKIENLGKTGADYISADKNLLILGDQKTNSIEKYVDGEFRQIPGLFKGLNFIKITGDKFLAGFNNDKAGFYDFEGNKLSEINYTSPVEPEILENDFVYSGINRIFVLDEKSEELKIIDKYVF